ncbi:2Fe-2S iron-sulfur cluster-binding protein [Streptomyces sp. NPDC051677]|uniref:2Fe-2S iron-sulfur cluster-binding protein n=1 Tax=Streptomyces sp. NPDC051677 TaxID=3365669 RepID=UPI0037D8259A
MTSITSPQPPVRQLGTGGFAPLRIAEIEALTGDSVALTLGGTEEYGTTFDFRAGQHLTLRREFDGRDVRRSYSLCVPPGAGALRIAVRRIDGGVMSTWLTQEAEIGDEIEVSAPTGDFGRGIAEATGRHVGLIGAGSGVTPLVSLAAAHLNAGPDNTALMVLGNRSSASVMLAEDLYDLKNRYAARMQLVHVFSREQQVADELNGHLDPARITRLLQLFGTPAAVADWYLCGPLPVVDNARTALTDLGVSQAAVHSELFHAGAVARPAEVAGSVAESTIVATLNGRRTTVSMTADNPSILDALLGVRSDAPFACRSGVCGTCRARCVSGEAVMRTNFALGEPEVEAGVILTCQALPASSAVELEYLS